MSVGIDLASDHVTECAFDSKTSLLDYDIVLLRPDITNFLVGASWFQGKNSLSDSASFRLKECSEHWRREIRDAVDSGKTVVIYLPEFRDIYVDSGNREYSGTGRNRQTTQLVDKYDNYRCIPAKIGAIPSKGASIKIAARDSEVLASYWKSFEEDSRYNVILTGDGLVGCLVTKNGEKIVGAILPSASSVGAIVLLPDLDFEKDEFYEDSAEGLAWSKSAEIFSARLVKEIVSLDRNIRSSGEHTQQPEWAANRQYELDAEQKIRSDLLRIEEKLEDLNRTKDELVESLEKAGQIRRLLYEKGKPLETAIVEALMLLGFSAAPYKNGDSEFDVVFEAAEGRFIGEAEGKDSKAINVDKLRQLSMNVFEDLQRDEIELPAKAVLFGNAFRLSPLEERNATFTSKCLSAAAANGTALISCPDLFFVAHYLSNHPNESFAKNCRECILSSVGIAVFPEIPSSAEVKKPTKRRNQG